MISGMNLLGYRDRYDTKTFFKKRVWRTGRALLLGSITCYLIYGLAHQYFYGTEKLAQSFGIKGFIASFLTNGVDSIYWFLYSILYLYVLCPILSRIVTHVASLQYTLFITMAVSVVIPLLHQIGIDARYTDTLFGWPFFSSIALFYFLSGYYLHHYVLSKTRVHPALAAGVFVVSTVLMVCFAFSSNGLFSPQGLNQNYNNYVIGISSPLCVVQAWSLFSLMRSLEESISSLPKRLLKVIRAFSGATLGVYLFHNLFINQLAVESPLRNVPLMRAVAIYLTMVCAVLVGKKIIALLKNAMQRILSQTTVSD